MTNGKSWSREHEMFTFLTSSDNMCLCVHPKGRPFRSLHQTKKLETPMLVGKDVASASLRSAHVSPAWLTRSTLSMACCDPNPTVALVSITEVCLDKLRASDHRANTSRFKKQAAHFAAADYFKLLFTTNHCGRQENFDLREQAKWKLERAIRVGIDAKRWDAVGVAAFALGELLGGDDPMIAAGALMLHQVCAADARRVPAAI